MRIFLLSVLAVALQTSLSVAQDEGKNNTQASQLVDLNEQHENALTAYVRGDHATAVTLWKPLAEQGFADAQFHLGSMYARGLGVPQNYTDAMFWFRSAAEQGLAGAEFNLGLMYSNGQGVPQDFAAAVRWYRLSAEQGLAMAQFNLGLMYLRGTGVPQDYVLGHMWSSLAAAQGIKLAAQNLEIVAGMMTEEQVTEAQRLAAEWQSN